MAVCGFVQPAPLFPLWVVAGDRGILEVRMGDPAPDCLRDDREPIVLEATRQLQAYFRGDLRDFDLPLDPRGTEFQQRVWAALRRIPYGETCTYQDLALELKSAARAVGQANGSNPIGIVVPCHRVIQMDGTLGGYGGGLDRKQYLLELERAACNGIRRRPKSVNAARSG